MEFDVPSLHAGMPSTVATLPTHSQVSCDLVSGVLPSQLRTGQVAKCSIYSKSVFYNCVAQFPVVNLELGTF